jgi:ACS family D-galactonate transporter-like MFS transporter
MPRDAPTPASRVADSAGMRDIVRQRAFWGASAVLFSSNYINYFLLTWLPYYLVRDRGFSMEQMGSAGAGIFLSYALALPVFGWLSDRWIAAGATPTLARKTITSTGLAGAGILLAICSTQEPVTAVVILCLAKAFHGACSSNQWAIYQTLAGPRSVGRWIGMQNCLANISGVIAPSATGLIVDATGGFIWPFMIAACVALGGAAAVLFVIGPVRQVDWPVRMAPLQSRLT